MRQAAESGGLPFPVSLDKPELSSTGSVAGRNNTIGRRNEVWSDANFGVALCFDCVVDLKLLCAGSGSLRSGYGSLVQRTGLERNGEGSGFCHHECGSRELGLALDRR